MPKKQFFMEDGVIYKQVPLSLSEAFEELHSMVVQFNKDKSIISLLECRLHSMKMDKLDILRELIDLEVKIDQKTDYEVLKEKVLSIINSVSEEEEE